MTSVKVKFRPSTVTGKMGSIYYQEIDLKRQKTNGQTAQKLLL